MDHSADIAIVGGGIVGLAHAYMSLKKGYRVVLFERDEFAVGASIRNFGLLWPIGQEPGEPLERALRSKQHWMTLSEEAGFWLNNNGSLHLAYHEDEWSVLQEFASLYSQETYNISLLPPAQVSALSPFAKQSGLKGALYSKSEGTVYSREAIKKITQYLVSAKGLILKNSHVVKEVSMPWIKTSRETWRVDKVIICSGADFETLYQELYDQQPITKCKLQMLKGVPQKQLSIGPSLCAGLTLRHYAAFTKCPSLALLNERYDHESIYFKEHGIHVLLAQNHNGELIIGDSHHYANTFDPFEDERISETILNYLYSFIDVKISVTERWHGIYPKLKGGTHLLLEAEKDVLVVNGLGGAGMTLSFGLAEDVINSL